MISIWYGTSKRWSKFDSTASKLFQKTFHPMTEKSMTEMKIKCWEHMPLCHIKVHKMDTGRDPGRTLE